MKLACSSSAFDNLLRSGELTQLEWIDLCAHELAADGVVFDVRHFPRTDTDYLAQVKKMAADLGLTVAAVCDGHFFAGGREAMERSLDIALTLGAPLLSVCLPSETGAGWTEVLELLGNATSAAKRANVTLALRNAPETFAATAHDMKRVSKEADSAWLRYGPELQALDAASDAAPLTAKSVLFWTQAGAGAQTVRTIASTLGTYCGFLALDDDAGGFTAQHMKNTLRELRKVLFEIEADRI